MRPPHPARGLATLSLGGGRVRREEREDTGGQHAAHGTGRSARRCGPVVAHGEAPLTCRRERRHPLPQGKRLGRGRDGVCG
jgi:hypothetical protein